MSKQKRSNKTDGKRFWVRVLCVILAVLLVGGTLTSLLVYFL